MDAITLESLAEQFYRRHNLDPSEPTSTYTLARLELGDDGVTRPPPYLTKYPASLYGPLGARQISLHRAVPANETQWRIGHELGHHILGRPHGAGEEIESACDYLGAALMAPRAAILGLYKNHGWDLDAIAGEVGATQTWAALRLAEVLELPLAAIGPTIRYRGPEGFNWPDARTVRGWAAGMPGPGLAKVPITDRPKRAVLALL